MKRVSTFDVAKAVRELKKVNIRPIDLLEIKNDHLVKEYLFTFGIDINQGIGFIYNKHRTLDNEVKEGYCYVGEIRTDDAFKRSPFCDESDRLILAGMKDRSLMQELATMQNISGVFGNLKEQALEDKDDDPAVLEDDHDKGVDKMQEYNLLIEQIRGKQYNEYGTLKTFKEWSESV